MAKLLKQAEKTGAPEGAYGEHVCPMAGLLETLTRPWTLHILWTLSHNGPTRFGVLRRSVVGISSRVLTERLRTLEEKGFLYRDYKPTIPPEVTYGLTKRVKDIQKVLADLGKLAQKWQMEDGPAENATKVAGRSAATLPA
jgi:DNA-binding HxlR family transcriptional regulator